MRRRKRYSTEVTLTEGQIDSLGRILDSWVECRAYMYPDGPEGGYAPEDRFCEVLLTKLNNARERITRRKRMDDQLTRVRKALMGSRTETKPERKE